MTESLLIKNKRSGLLYRLWRINQDSWYIASNDGRVPSGQPIYGFCLVEVLDGINCEIVKSS